MELENTFTPSELNSKKDNAESHSSILFVM